MQGSGNYSNPQDMIADIESEARLTESYTGRRKFGQKIMAAMATVPRHNFVPENMKQYAYVNSPLAIGYGQTISQPYIVALMTDLLDIEGRDANVLEIGTGCGYQTAILAEIAKQVYSIEVINELAEQAELLLRKLGYKNIVFKSGDGYFGWPEHAPYDGILVTAAATNIPPALTEQLKPGGKLVIPVGGRYTSQDLLLVRKGKGGTVNQRKILPVAFVPFRHDSGETFN